jgi:ubiquinone/menaquinone biosynthesis C-methylase UbiE
MATPPLTPLAAAVLAVGSPERVLEIECGEGDGVLFLAREFPRASVRGLDRSEAAVRRAASRVGLDPEGRVAFKAGGPRQLPFPAEHFDLVVLRDASPPVAEVARVLRPGGFLVLAHSSRDSVPHGVRAWLERRRLARHRIDPVRAECAGDGSFSVNRLRERERSAPAL